MAIAVLVRHGESTKNIANITTSKVTGYPLTQEGRKTAESIAAALEPVKSQITSLYAGPALRARQTIAPIAKMTGLKPHISSLLRERDEGIFEGKEWNSLEEILENIQRSIEQGYPEGGPESWTSMQQRVVRFVSRLRPEEIAVIAIHNDPIVPLLGHYGLLENEDPRYRVPMGSFTVIDTSRRGSEAVLALGAISLDGSAIEAIRANGR